jgi:uncharacterized protein YidB (DUF937 family)
MGLLDGLVSGVLKNALGQIDSATVQNVLSQLLANSNLGGFGGLLAQLQKAGLDREVASWLGNGANLPVTPEQLRAALGNEQIQELARSAGLPVDDLLKALSQHLPQTVDTMSPDGRLDADAGGSLQQQAGIDNIRA